MASIFKNRLLHFLARFILITIVLLFCDFGIGNILRFFYFQQEAGAPYRTTYSIDCTTAELLIFGSSRANHHYVPEIFEDSLQCTFYNTGRDGNFILYNYAIFKSITTRYKPKIVIFDINPDELRYSTISYERLSNLLPYYKNQPEIRDIIHMRSPFEKIKLISSIYPFNSMLTTITVGNLKFNKNRKSDNKGYVPIFKKMAIEKISTLKIGNSSDGRIDSFKVAAISDIITTCKKNNIKLLFVQSPNYYGISETSDDSTFTQLCIQNRIEYFNFANQPYFLDHPEFFADKSHLNDMGAKAFSRMLVQNMNDTIQRSGMK